MRGMSGKNIPVRVVVGVVDEDKPPVRNERDRYVHILVLPLIVFFA